MIRRWKIAGTLCVLLPALVFGAMALKSRGASLADGDRHYRQKSYAAALAAYSAALKADAVPAQRRDEVRYRMVVCLGKTDQWDRALDQGLEFVKSHRKTVWEPRGLYWLGRLYLAVPHQGYRVGKSIRRGENVPQTGGDDKPEPIELQAQDEQNARDALEAARVTFPAYRGAAHTEAEEIQLDFDLASLLHSVLADWASKQKWLPPTDPSWTIHTDEAYSLRWPPPKKLMFLYAQIQALAAKAPPPELGAGVGVGAPPALGQGDSPPSFRKGVGGRRAHSAALGLLGKALWLRQYHPLMQSYAVRYEKSKAIPIPYPYQTVFAEDVLRQLVRDFPEDAVRDQAQFTLAAFLEGDGKFTAALAEYRRLIAVRPRSKWVSDARAHSDGITRRQISLEPPSSALPGKPMPLTVSYRNVARIHFDIFRIKLEDTMAASPRLRKPENNLNQFDALFGSVRKASRRYGPKVASWDWKTADRGDYRPRQSAIKVPVTAAGAYGVQATAPGVKSAVLLPLSNIVVIQNIHRDGGLYYVANARTGAPVPNAHLLAKEVWDTNGKQECTLLRATTNAQGMATVPLLRKAGRSSFQLSVFAYKAHDYAVTDSSGGSDSTDNPGTFKVYSTTDRAVYRPAQTVHYRQLVMQRVQGGFKPVVDRPVKVEVEDPQGRLLHKQSLITGEFGSVHGEFPLAVGCPLGEYQINVTVPKVAEAGTEYGGNRFRVEEYKKPEFEITVAPDAERVQLGQTATAKVSAKYYFGGPVPNAKVTYRVYRNPWTQMYHFPRPFDFLYAGADNGDYDTDYHRGEVVTQGTARTDAAGEAKITFPTKAESRRFPKEDDLGYENDFSYTVEADVQDSSRRVISGVGSVKATHHEAAVFLDFPHGYATRGDLLDIEIRTVDTASLPLSVSGMVTVYRKPDTPDGKETAVTRQALATDKQGRAIFRWTAPAGACYRVQYEIVQRPRLEGVKGSLDLWVDGPELAKGRFLRQGLYMVAANPYYEEGQTAKVLLVSQDAGSTVLLTREADNEILDKRLVHIPGHSIEISVPLSHRDVPNVFLSAVTIRNNQMYEASQELFVPPARQFASVTVQADKERYEPGEKAKLRLSAHDWQGRPLRTELSVSIADAALSYIQKDYAPDVRVYFYGDRRSNSIATEGSVQTSFQPGQEDTQPTRPYKEHDWTPPDGMGQLADWPGKEKVDIVYGNVEMDPAQSNGVVIKNRRLGLVPAYSAAEADGLTAGIARARRADSGKPTGGRVVRAPGDTGVIGMGVLMPQRYPSSSTTPLPKRPADTFHLGDGYFLAAQPRTKFVDTAFWTPAAVTDAQGSASVEVTWPDNLTQWRACAIGNSAAAQVGTAETRVTTKKDLLVRLEAPRFFVERDEVVLSAVVHNALPQSTHVKVRLDLGSDAAVLAPEDPASAGNPLSQENAIEVPKDGEKRLDWRVHVRHAGLLRVRMTALSQAASDAEEQTFPVIVHGVERLTVQSGVMRDQNRATLDITLPEARKPGSSELVVQLNPSLGGVMLDALPYLNGYPYGCVEQTMSRFLPSVVVAKTLKDLGYNLEDLKKRAELLEAQARQGKGSAAVADSPYTYPKGKPGTAPSLSRRWNDPVFNSAELQRMVREGLAKIAGLQHRDGGWGWWPDDHSDAYMSAYVLYGLITARNAGYAVYAGMLTRGLNYLKGRCIEDDDLHRMAYEARVLAMEPNFQNAIRPLTTGRLYDHRERLKPYSKALLAQALHDLGDNTKAAIVLRNLESTAHVDAANGTANWDDHDRFWWRWYDDKVETNAAILQAYMAIQPTAKLTPMLVKWLVNNRRGDIWSSTKETAMAVYALVDYVRVNKELAPDYTLTVDLGGRVQRRYKVTRANALFFDNRFVVPDSLLQTGAQPLTLTKSGAGTCYYTAYTRTFSQEEPIRATGGEIAVTRRYFRLLPDTASGPPAPTPLDTERPNPFLTGQYELLTSGGEAAGYEDNSDGPRYQRTALQPNDLLTSGDLLEVELLLESKNDYDYLVFEDAKPSGCEPVEVRSGGYAGSGVYSNREFRDQKVAFFLDHLPQGTRTLSYRVRAEIPGRFHVLPTNGYAMYAPDLRTLSDETTLTIRDAN
jgi:uncharacterized protein YfaS (alpha-2-macroglobulin family)